MCEYIYLQEKGLHERIRPITSAPPNTVSNTKKDGKKREIKGHKCTTLLQQQSNRGVRRRR